MSAGNGSNPRRCGTCHHGVNERAFPGAPIGSPHVLDCEEELLPIVVGMTPQGAQMVPGGYYKLVFPDLRCGRWKPRLAVLAGHTVARAEPLTVAELQPPEKDPA